MPQHRSCAKRMRTSAKAKARNKAYRTKMRIAIRNVREAKSFKDAESSLHVASKILDRLASKGIIHRNNAANRKSRLNSFVKTIQG
ncbi:MAG: 30S ribosomal protein S20 [Candidatus Electryonea clarkiae]|nr:30S ribosomal protein S20 [Candidatus Electryonea clarkiae]MDP8288086.1 30S ribosomal protein S20 [Candidatus Electryonea clarkiae]